MRWGNVKHVTIKLRLTWFKPSWLDVWLDHKTCRSLHVFIVFTRQIFKETLLYPLCRVWSCSEHSVDIFSIFVACLWFSLSELIRSVLVSCWCPEAESTWDGSPDPAGLKAVDGPESVMMRHQVSLCIKLEIPAGLYVLGLFRKLQVKTFKTILRPFKDHFKDPPHGF